MADAKWYVVHTQTGVEAKARASLISHAETAGLPHLIHEVLIPMEKISEVKGGKKRISERKFFPGYILVKMELTDESWYLVRNTPGISGFIGSGKNPIPLTEKEVGEIIREQEEKQTKPKPKVEFEIIVVDKIKHRIPDHFGGSGSSIQWEAPMLSSK